MESTAQTLAIGITLSLVPGIAIFWWKEGDYFRLVAGPLFLALAACLSLVAIGQTIAISSNSDAYIAHLRHVGEIRNALLRLDTLEASPKLRTEIGAAIKLADTPEDSPPTVPHWIWMCGLLIMTELGLFSIIPPPPNLPRNPPRAGGDPKTEAHGGSLE